MEGINHSFSCTIASFQLFSKKVFAQNKACFQTSFLWFNSTNKMVVSSQAALRLHSVPEQTICPGGVVKSTALHCLYSLLHVCRGVFVFIWVCVCVLSQHSRSNYPQIQRLRSADRGGIISPSVPGTADCNNTTQQAYQDDPLHIFTQSQTPNLFML